MDYDEKAIKAQDDGRPMCLFIMKDGQNRVIRNRYPYLPESVSREEVNKIKKKMKYVPKHVHGFSDRYKMFAEKP